jgi:hypothetical protein
MYQYSIIKVCGIYLFDLYKIYLSDLHKQLVVTLNPKGFLTKITLEQVR